MKKHFFFALFLTVLPSLFVACNDKDDDTEQHGSDGEQELNTYFDDGESFLRFLIKSDNEVEVSGIIKSLHGIDVNSTSFKTISIPNKVVIGKKTYTVTSIGYRAFKDCSELSSINIPESVNSIAVSAFEGCSEITELNLPKGLGKIGNRAFYNCNKLTVQVPNNEGINIGKTAFYGCANAYNGTVGNYTYVDLGLPSGTKWATYNVGATNSLDNGEYFAMGSNDAASANWGSAWRTPSKEEFEELIDNCNWDNFTLDNGYGAVTEGYVGGMVGTSKINGMSIFIKSTPFYRNGNFYPQMHYWTSTVDEQDHFSAYCLDDYAISTSDRTNNYSVRAIVN